MDIGHSENSKSVKATGNISYTYITESDNIPTPRSTVGRSETAFLALKYDKGKISIQASC